VLFVELKHWTFFIHTRKFDDLKDKRRKIVQEVVETKERITKLVTENRSIDDVVADRCGSFVHILRVFQVEILCALKDWKRIPPIVEEIGRSDSQGVDTTESIADILWAHKDCPVDVLFSALESILHASLEHKALSLEKFSRWLRAICTILLSRDSGADRPRAIGFVEQAISVLKEQRNVEVRALVRSYPRGLYMYYG